MPDHASWLTLLLEHVQETLEHNADLIGVSLMGENPTWLSFEPLIASALVALVLLLVSLSVRSRLSADDNGVVPDDTLTLRTFMEAFLGYFYDLSRTIMDEKRAQKYFPVIGASACFVFCANVMAIIPGMPVATSSLSITAGSALVVFVLFNLYGLKENGLDYIKHLAGPLPALWPLMFVIEVISLCVRPVTLAVRLMLNMAVDHLLLTIFLGFLPLLLPLPVMVLGCLVIVVQTLVFTLLTTIYIGLATEHEAH